jgi:MFS family permease
VVSLTEAVVAAEPPADPSVERTHDGWWLLGVAVIAQAGFSVIEQGIPLLAGFIRADLGLSATGVGLAVSSFAVGKILGSYLAGMAADAFGERRMLVAGGLASAMLIILAAVLPTPLPFALFALAGMAGAPAAPAGSRLVMTAFSRRRYGLALGLRQAGVPIGGLVAAAILPWVAQTWSWRWSLVVACALTSASVVPLTLRSSVDRSSRFAVLARAADGGGPPADRAAIRLLTLWGCLLVSGQFVVITFLGPDLHERIGLSLASASLVVAATFVMGIVGRVGWGILSDRMLARGRKWLLVLLTVLAFCSTLLLLVLPASVPVAAFVVAAAFAGLALLGYQGVWHTMIAEAAGPERVGKATGFAVTFVLVAIALTPPLFGAVADLAGTFRAVWAALAIVLAAALIPALALTESGDRQRD